MAEACWGPLWPSHRLLTYPISFPKKNPLLAIIYNFFSLFVISRPTPCHPLGKTLCRTTCEGEMQLMKGIRIIFEIYKVQRHHFVNFKLLCKRELTSSQRAYLHDRAGRYQLCTQPTRVFIHSVYIHPVHSICSFTLGAVGKRVRQPLL